LNRDIPPGKWWQIAKSISNFTKARDPPSFLEHDDEIFIYPSDNAEWGLPLPLKIGLTWAIFHKRGTCLIERNMLKNVVSGLKIE
jgi:hypothetical protein